MSEVEEVATAMLPRYLEHMKSAPWIYQGHTVVGIREYVMRELRATESYGVIDGVSDALIELVFPNNGPSPYQPL